MSEQIAVLDGFDTSSISVSPIGPIADGRIGQLKAGSYPQFSGLQGSPLLNVSPIGPIPDGRIGQQKAQVDQYGRLIMPRVLSRINVIDASEGANYSGGSSYAPGLPLLPSSVGLAGLADSDLLNFSDSTSSLDALEGRFGQKFKKFSKKAAKSMLLPPGASMLLGDAYGRAGLGGCGCPALDGLGGPLLTVSPIGPIPDGRIGQQKAQIDQYGRLIMPRVLSRINVIDASEGANYSGGSSYAPGLPLLPSSVGLAGALEGRFGQKFKKFSKKAAKSMLLPPGASMLLGDAYGRAGLGDMPGVLPARRNVINPSQGANYSGGASWAPGIPLISSTSGLAALEGKLGRRLKRKFKKIGKSVLKLAAPLIKFGGKLIPIPGASMVTDMVGGAIGDAYGRAGLGEADVVGLEGLGELGVMDDLDVIPLSEFKMLTPDAKKLFERTAGVAVLRAVENKAQIGRLRKNGAEVQQAGRQLATARSVRRQLMGLPAGARVNSGQLNVIIKAVSDTVARGGVTTEGNPKMAALRAVILNIRNAVDSSPMGAQRG